MQLLRPVIATLRELKSRVVLFIEPGPKVLARVIQVGGEGIQIFTGGDAADFRARRTPQCLTRVPKPRGRHHPTALSAMAFATLMLPNDMMFFARHPVLALGVPFTAGFAGAHMGRT
jgi:pyridoxine 5'-phosphate synthase PdxJ